VGVERTGQRQNELQRGEFIRQDPAGAEHLRQEPCHFGVAAAGENAHRDRLILQAEAFQGLRPRVFCFHLVQEGVPDKGDIHTGFPVKFSSKGRMTAIRSTDFRMISIRPFRHAHTCGLM